MKAAKVRLYVDHPLAEGQSVPVTREQAHYLYGVMRMSRGDEVALFNGRDGEFVARVVEAGRRGGSLICGARRRALRLPPDLWLLFAPVKKTRTDFIVEKAVELGVARIVPVRTDHTNSERVRRDRLQARAIEAAEQCGATFVPEINELAPLGQVLDGWDEARRIMFCDEARAGAAATMDTAAPGPWAVLIGPEGGFSPAERDRLRAMPQVLPVALGPRILRADTAAVAALTLWQARLGDWACADPPADSRRNS